jgi:hypothetical protein
MTLEEQVAALQRRVDAQERELQSVKAAQQAHTARRRFSGAGAVAAAFLVGLTLACAGRAYAVTSTPSHSEFTLTVMQGADSAPWTLPVADSPVTLTASCITPGGPSNGTSFVHLTYHSSLAGLTWGGVHAATTAATSEVAGGYTTADNQRIVDVALAGEAEIRSHQAGGKLNQLLVHNNSGVFSHTFAIEMTW